MIGIHCVNIHVNVQLSVKIFYKTAKSLKKKIKYYKAIQSLGKNINVQEQ